MRNRTILYQDRGNPLEVLSLEEFPMPKPGKGEVLIQMLAATIHPSDFGLINGSYGKLRDLPAVGGREGVGKQKKPRKVDKRAPRGGPNGNQRIPHDSRALRPQSNPLGPMDTERYHQPQWTND